MKCARCGKKLGFFEKKKQVFVVRQGKKVLCLPCFQQYIKELKSRKSCLECAYSESVEKRFMEDIFYTIYQCKKLDLKLRPFSIKVSGELGVSRDFYFDAEKCVHFITEEEYREMALKEEIVKGQEAYCIICGYCETRYDASKYSRCPNCGASRKQEVRELRR